jgi:hypothetical protein
MTGQQVMDFKQISWHIDLNQRLIWPLVCLISSQNEQLGYLDEHF